MMGWTALGTGEGELGDGVRKKGGNGKEEKRKGKRERGGKGGGE